MTERSEWGGSLTPAEPSSAAARTTRARSRVPGQRVEAREIPMRHRTKLLAGSAVAVALLAGSAVRWRSRGVSLCRIDGRRVAAGDLGERALRDRPGRYAGHDRQARGTARQRRRKSGRARDARSRLPGALARDRRRVVPASLRRGARGGARRASPRPDRNARARKPGADPASVRQGARPRHRSTEARAVLGEALRCDR